jgi:hypothetical protein
MYVAEKSKNFIIIDWGTGRSIDVCAEGGEFLALRTATEFGGVYLLEELMM